MKASIVYTLPLVSAALFAAPAAIAVETDCDDPEAVAAWQDLLQRYPDDHDLRNLYLLRDELCLSVERGSVGLVEAAERFERARERLIQKWQQQNQRREEGAVGAG
jgi:hypothetical protein